MPRHAHPDVHRPVNDNKPMKHHEKKEAGHHMKKMEIHEAGRHERTPQATSLPGSLPIIHSMHGRRDGIHGIPGIISSTTTGPEIRQRLISGILDPCTEHKAQEGPVSVVHGVDSTAYNTGMVHIRGSPFTSHHGKK